MVRYAFLPALYNLSGRKIMSAGYRSSTVAIPMFKMISFTSADGFVKGYDELSDVTQTAPPGHVP
jgi:hypothetical protein